MPDTPAAVTKNSNLTAAKRAKNDEFYTQWADIEREMNAYLEYDPDVFRGKTILLPCDDPEWSNFTKYFALRFTELGIKKLISTSYAPASNGGVVTAPPSATQMASPHYDAEKFHTHGRIFTLTPDDLNGDGRIDADDIEWDYLDGDGDFRSPEVTALRDEANLAITNPPFSLFREFVAWLIEGDVQFCLVGNKNAITYKEVFPLIAENKLWIGAQPMGADMLFGVPPEDAQRLTNTEDAGSKYRVVDGVVKARAQACWFTNIDHGRRHDPLQLMTEADNIRFSKHKDVRGVGYQTYDNYDAIEVPRVDAIPSDYPGVMGVPITFLDKYNPDQFEILGLDRYVSDNPRPGHRFHIAGREIYARILIRHRKPQPVGTTL